MNISPEAVIAANRFGLGARPGDLQYIGDQPREWLLSQVDNTQPIEPVRNLPDSKTVLSIFFDTVTSARKRAERDETVPPAAAAEVIMKPGQKMRPIYQQYVLARATRAIESDSPFYERLVHFWSNHFAISIKSPQLSGLAGTFEIEAIRPNITGNFYDLLFAVETHPAMLAFLDNQFSIGANSAVARQVRRRGGKRKTGINENLAREILELHTLGVNGGYSQEDVTSFAKVISGWTYGGLARGKFNTGPVGEFQFNKLMHEPGTQTLLNKDYRQPGFEQGTAVLKDLVQHPATARHLATKLARHFIADEPPEPAINAISKAYLQSYGDLPAVYAALIASDAAWQQPFAKYKSPEDFVHSAYRAINFKPHDPRQLLRPLTVLGQQPFQSGSPAGWPDTAQEWSGGEALFKRIEFSSAVAAALGNSTDPIVLANDILGPLLGDHTQTAIRRAESASQGIALLLASPEFLRR